MNFHFHKNTPLSSALRTSQTPDKRTPRWKARLTLFKPTTRKEGEKIVSELNTAKRPVDRHDKLVLRNGLALTIWSLFSRGERETAHSMAEAIGCVYDEHSLLKAVENANKMKYLDLSALALSGVLVSYFLFLPASVPSLELALITGIGAAMFASAYFGYKALRQISKKHPNVLQKNDPLYRDIAHNTALRTSFVLPSLLFFMAIPNSVVPVFIYSAIMLLGSAANLFSSHFTHITLTESCLPIPVEEKTLS